MSQNEFDFTRILKDLPKIQNHKNPVRITLEYRKLENQTGEKANFVNLNRETFNISMQPFEVPLGSFLLWLSLSLYAATNIEPSISNLCLLVFRLSNLNYAGLMIVPCN